MTVADPGGPRDQSGPPTPVKTSQKKKDSHRTVLQVLRVIGPSLG